MSPDAVSQNAPASRGSRSTRNTRITRSYAMRQRGGSAPQGPITNLPVDLLLRIASHLKDPADIFKLHRCSRALFLPTYAALTFAALAARQSPGLPQEITSDWTCQEWAEVHKTAHALNKIAQDDDARKSYKDYEERMGPSQWTLTKLAHGAGNELLWATREAAEYLQDLVASQKTVKSLDLAAFPLMNEMLTAAANLRPVHLRLANTSFGMPSFAVELVPPLSSASIRQNLRSLELVPQKDFALWHSIADPRCDHAACAAVAIHLSGLTALTHLNLDFTAAAKPVGPLCTRLLQGEVKNHKGLAAARVQWPVFNEQSASSATPPPS